MKALSFRQPWCDAILNGGKRIENRTAWSSSSFRGPFLIHASAGMTKREYRHVAEWADATPGLAWRPPPIEALRFGGFVGRARVVGVVSPFNRHPFAGTLVRVDGQRERALLPDEEIWWMEAFALVLADVEPLDVFVPWKGALGFFNVNDEAFAKALEAARRTPVGSTWGGL